MVGQTPVALEIARWVNPISLEAACWLRVVRSGCE
jgi:hypothetical protein